MRMFADNRLFCLIAAAILPLAALAQQFGPFMLVSQLTTYENTLLDATNFIVATSEDVPSIQESPATAFIAFSSPSSTLPLIAPTSSISSDSSTSLPVPLTLGVPPHVPLTTTSASSTTASAPSATRYTNLWLANPTATTATPVAPVDSRSRKISTTDDSNLGTTPVASTGAVVTSACTGNSVRSWVTLLVTESATATITSSTLLYRTKFAYYNSTDRVTSHNTSTSRVTEVIAATSTGGSTSSLTYSKSSSSSFSTSTSLESPSLPLVSPVDSMWLTPPASVAVCRTAAATATVTTTVYRTPSLPSLSLVTYNGTRIVAIASSPQSTCAGPAWPFYENPQWASLPPTLNTALPPQRQLIPSQRATDQLESFLVGRDFQTNATPSDATITTQSTVGVTTIIHTIPTSCSAIGSAAFSQQDSGIINGDSAPRGTSSIVLPSFLATNSPPSSPVTTTTDFANQPGASQPTLTSSTVGRDINGFISSLLQGVFGSGSSSTEPLVLYSTQPNVPVPIFVTETAATVILTTHYVDTEIPVTHSSSIITITTVATTTTSTATTTEFVSFADPIPTVKNTAVPPSTAVWVILTSSVQPTQTGGSAIIVSQPSQSKAIISSSTLDYTTAEPITSASGAAARLSTAALEITTVTEGIAPVTRNTTLLFETSASFPATPIITAPYLSSSDSSSAASKVHTSTTANEAPSRATSLALYQCAPWTSGNDVLVCLINGGMRQRLPMTMFAGLVTATSVLLFAI